MKARWHGKPYHDYSTKKWLITIETDTAPAEYDETKDVELNVTFKRWRAHRSINANSYFHVLVDKIAEKRSLSHQEVHNLMICRYGRVDEVVRNVIMADDIPWMQLDYIHLRPTTRTRTMDNGKLYRIYEVMRGSHTYDTKEMSVLIDGAVHEAKELGIETLPPDEIERMKQQWSLS